MLHAVLRTQIRILTIGLAAAAALGVAAPPAHAAATGRVVVFSHELAHATTYDDPDGCYALPVGAHVIVNLTDATIQTYADPGCLIPTLSVRPGYGTHVSAVGSFTA